jgi:hypothetical protein
MYEAPFSKVSQRGVSRVIIMAFLAITLLAPKLKHDAVDQASSD